MMTRTTLNRLALTAGLVLGIVSSGLAVKVSEVTWKKRKCFKVETGMGTFYWESAKNRSGFMSFVDKDGWDWVQSGYGIGRQGKPLTYRGWPNHHGNWGHPSRDNGTSLNKIVGAKEGDEVVIEAKSSAAHGKVYCYDSHLYLKMSSVANKVYGIVYEGTPGGATNCKEFVLPDGTKKKAHNQCGSCDWPDDGGGEWFYLVGTKSDIRLWFAHTPAGKPKGECYSEKGHMDVFSFGRTCEFVNRKRDWERYFKGPDHQVMCGFITDPKTTHEEIATMIRAIIKEPMKPYKTQQTAAMPGGATEKAAVSGNLLKVTGSSIMARHQGSRIRLLDLNGRTVRAFIGAGTHILETQALKPGLYLVQLTVPGTAIQETGTITCR